MHQDEGPDAETRKSFESMKFGGKIHNGMAGFVLASMLLVPLPAFGVELTWPDRISLLTGRLHPAIVHFPIALLLCAALLELLGSRFRKGTPSTSVRPLLWLGALGAVAAALAGWVNASHQEFSGSLERVVFVHRWAGVAVASFAVVSLLLFETARRRAGAAPRMFRACLYGTAALVIACSHYGGLLVHGEDYYAAPFAGTRLAGVFGGEAGEESHTRADRRVVTEHLRRFPAAARPVAFDADVKPILQSSCGKCHLDGKDKGGFRLDTRPDLLRGGNSGHAAVVPGDSERSYLVELVAAVDPDAVMPEKGRRLTADEVGVLRAWIDQGAHWGTQETIDQFQKAPMEPREVRLPAGQATHPVDRFLSVYFERNGIEPGELIDDRTFARKVYLDVLGILPSASELRAFLADSGEGKREALVDRVLENRLDYAAHWLTFWNDALRNGYSGPGFLHGNRKEITAWLYGALLDNKPYDQFVRELVNPSPETVGFTRGVLWWKNPEQVNPNEHPAMQASQAISQVFMGINMKCASCHDSFTDAWKLEDAYGVANVYAIDPLEMHECAQPLGEVPSARFFYPGDLAIDSPITERLDELLQQVSQKAKGNRGVEERRRQATLRKARRERMEQFASALTDERNGRFARTIVNRLWAAFFGRGIVEPVDELDNEPWSADLLDWLANDFVQNGHDLKHTMRLLLTSRAYQLRAQPAQESYGTDWVFRGPVVRRMSGEQILDSVRRFGNFSPALSVDEAARIVKLVSKEFAAEGTLGRPSLRFSRTYVGGTDPVEIDVDIRDAETLWLAVVPRHKVLSRLERLAAEHERVQAAEAESPKDFLDASGTVAGGEDTVKLRRELTEKLGDLLELAIWASPVLAGADGEVPLGSIPPSRAVAEDDLVLIDTGRDGEPLTLSGVPVQSGIGVLPLGLVRYDLSGRSFDRFRATIGLDRPLEGPNHEYQFLVITDFEVRSAFRDTSELLWTLGRPKREQVITTRSNIATTMAGLELTKSEEFLEMVRSAAERLHREAQRSPDLLIADVYFRLLGREPSSAEAELFRTAVGDDVDLAELEDILWAVLMLPEYQLIG